MEGGVSTGNGSGGHHGEMELVFFHPACSETFPCLLLSRDSFSLRCSVSLCRDHASCPSVPPQIHISSQQLCHRCSHELPPQLKLPALILLLFQFLPRPRLVAGHAAGERALGRGSGPPGVPPSQERGEQGQLAVLARHFGGPSA